ncbi:MAG TPA: clostripain-related cysteine peptidase [Roseiflexaceae bacterium]|nr:clostripain-related cysteine peptidase [Roseiflexaceae bacterium]
MLVTRVSARTLARFVRLMLAITVLAGLLAGCVDTPDHPPTPTRPRRTATPRPRATPTPRPGPRATPQPSAQKRAAWTVLVYLDGDNDLEQEALGDFTEMATVGSSDDLHIVVQFDRIDSSEDWDAATYGDWSGVKRFRIERGKRPVKSNQVADLGERNMGDPKTLSDFLTWGITTYPAQHYALIFWDHGASWPGVASDDTSDGDMLTLPELAQALADSSKRTGVEKLDLIGFDACLMGQIDVMQAIAPYGNVAIGSADLEPGEGWAWNAWLADVAKRPPGDGMALAPSIIKSFTAFYKQEDDPSVTLAAFDLTRMSQMTDQLDTLADAMITSMPTSYKAIAKARSMVAEYASGDEDISAVDLGHFADSLVSAGAGKQVDAAARALSATIKAARISLGKGADHPRSSGISIYFPQKKKDYDTSYVKASPLTRASRWDEFLRAFYAGRTRATRSTAGTPAMNRTEIAPTAPLELSTVLSGDDTAYVYSVVAVVPPDAPDTLKIVSMDFLYPPGAAPDWHDGDTARLSWPATSWYLSNGAQVALAPVFPTEYGAQILSVDGTYRVGKSRRSLPVSVEFRIAGGRGTLEHIWAFDKGDSAHARPREITPKAGDTFTPAFTVFDLASSSDDEQSLAGTPIKLGDQALTLFEAPAASGDYVIGVLVENISGDIADQFEDVQVTSPYGDQLPPLP